MNKNSRPYVIVIGILGTLAVLIGAFGAHGLKPKLTADSLAAFETGVDYHFIHVLAMFMAVILYFAIKKQKSFLTAFWLFFSGVLLFSGSIYFLSTRDITGLNLSWLGPVTPIGGLLFVAGWLSIIIGGIKK